jgi:hypothetical protein
MVAKLDEGQDTFRRQGIAKLLEDALNAWATDEASSCYMLHKVVAQAVEFVFAVQQRPPPGSRDRLAMLCEVNATVGPGVEQ